MTKLIEADTKDVVRDWRAMSRSIESRLASTSLASMYPTVMPLSDTE